jgi:hypothetical protein
MIGNSSAIDRFARLSRRTARVFASGAQAEFQII